MDCNAALNVQADGVLLVRLAGCGVAKSIVPSGLTVVPSVLSLRMLNGVATAVFVLPAEYTYAGGAASNLKLDGRQFPRP